MTREQDCTLTSSATEKQHPTLVSQTGLTRSELPVTIEGSTSPASVATQPEINGMRDTLITGMLVIYPVVATALAIAAGLFLIGRGA